MNRDFLGIVAYRVRGLPQSSDHAAFEWSQVPAMAVTRLIGEEPDPSYFTDEPSYD